MKLLINKILLINFIIKIRNFLGIKPVIIKSHNLKNNYSISDAFLWRTDDDFHTVFNYSDLPKIFYKDEESKIQIIFFNKNNDFIKEINIADLKLSNKIMISENNLGGIKDYGVFYIFHKTKKNFFPSIRNSCYVGFSKNDNLESYVHGNLPSVYKEYNSKKINYGIISKSFFKNKKYRLQEHFNDFTKSEIFINNSTDGNIKFYIDKRYYKLKKGCSKIIDISNNNELDIYSNCFLLRPIIFNYINDYIDVHHA